RLECSSSRPKHLDIPKEERMSQRREAHRSCFNSSWRCDTKNDNVRWKMHRQLSSYRYFLQERNPYPSM
ncbi:unnamed protein product, partial [Trichobilharzia szidati]